ncbi:3-hydroxyacyl-CoA dehydrogenase NAD-binding domain-containing protein [Desulfothermus sp.]
MKLEDIRKVLVVGAGTMGQQIALQVSLYGFDVCLYDIQKDILNNALRRIKDLGQKLIQNRKWTNKQIEQALVRIKFTTDPEEAAYNADFLSESVPENPDLKSKVFA